MASIVTESSSAPHIMYPEFKDKVVLLTGIGQSGDQEMWGNGASTARVLCQNGAKIFGCDLRLPAAEHTQRRLQAEGGTCDVIAADVTKEEDVKALVDACMKKYGRIDVLVNNVGMSEPGGPAEMAPSVWDKQTDVNLKSVYLCCHFVLPIMESAGSGVVINISSIAVSWTSCQLECVDYNKLDLGNAIYWKATGQLLSDKSGSDSVH